MSIISEQPTRRAEIVAFIIAEIARLSPAVTGLTEDSDITADVHLDSVATMDLVFALEEKYDLAISLNDLADTYKISQLADLVASSKGGSAHG